MKSNETFVDKFLLFLITILIFYIFWFQYSFFPIDWLLTLLGVILIGASLVKLNNINFFVHLLYVVAFMVVMLVSGSLFSENHTVFLSTYSTMVNKLLPMIAIYSYVGTDKKRLKKIFIVISIATGLMSISLIRSGQVSATGALVMGDLNSNKFSCYLFLGLVANLYLINESKSKLTRWFLVFLTIICAIAQIYSASRRGVIVFVFLIVMYFHTIISIRYKGKIIYKIASVIVIGFIVGMVFILFSDKFENLVVIQRFFHNTTTGDQLRASYQSTALHIFLESPILGKGPNAVAIRGGVYSHSLYYELIATGGIVGTFVILFPLIRQFLHCIRVSKHDIEYTFQIQLRIIAWSIIGFLLTGIAVVYIYDPDFYIMIGLLAAYNHILDATGYGKRYRVVIGNFRLT